MKHLKYYVCILCVIFGSAFTAAAASEAEEELNAVVAEAKSDTGSADGAADNESNDSSSKSKKKSTAHSKRSSSVDGKLLLTAGGGLSVIIPGVEIIHNGYNDWNQGDCDTSVFVAFGFNVLANVTLTYEVKNEWAIGGAVNLGYNFMGGPHAQFEHRYKNDKYQTTYNGFGKLYHSFIADLNFAARSPMRSNGDLLMEVGIRFMPTWGFNVYRQDGVTKIGDTAYSKKSYTNFFTGKVEVPEFQGIEGAFMAGPDFFIGIDYFLKDYLDIIGGLRIGAVFGCANTKYIDANVFKQSYLNSIITIALEAKINWCRKF
ncbi:MAG: hypothetical protein IKN25_02095 [Spirochaetales bacterium]|nr:hypothetical protein [Spirochaetales bacterium]